MSIIECDLIRGVTYKRYHYDPSIFKYTIPNLVLIHRTLRRNIKNEKEIVDMLAYLKDNLNVYTYILDIK